MKRGSIAPTDDRSIEVCPAPGVVGRGRRLGWPALADSEAARTRLARQTRALGAALALLACEDPTSPADGERQVAGLYLLVAVDGVTARPDGVSRLSLTERINSTSPQYGWEVFGAAGESLAADFGLWARVRGQSVEFRSTQGRGSYASAVARAPDDTMPSVDVPGPNGRRYTFRRVLAADAVLGYARVVIVDATTGAQVPGGGLDVTSGEGLRQRVGSPASGSYVVGGGPGAWTLTLKPPAGYALAPGEANPRQITVVAGVERATQVRFALVRTGG